MKIGIITFHWATNYGAVLQAYALQQYLAGQGHAVEIINYKPRHYDFGWIYFRRPWLLRNLRKDLVAQEKEKRIMPFRDKYLNLTKRFFSTRELERACFDYDMIISGSDQVLNPSFTISGENHPASAYYLTFTQKARRVGYAVSFGCTTYPAKELEYARRWINSFSIIGVREQTGISILNEMGFNGNACLVPDPTILLGKELFRAFDIPNQSSNNYICCYVLRQQIVIKTDNVIYIDEMNNPVSMEEWLSVIINSRGLITNSYHGMIMAILNHVPFVAIKTAKGSVGMNDRFITLLNKLQLANRLTDESTDYLPLLSNPINWDEVDERMRQFRQEGAQFILKASQL